MSILTLQPSNGFPAIGEEGPVGAEAVDVGPLDEIGCVVGTTEEMVVGGGGAFELGLGVSVKFNFFRG